jgi:hypothetical protein
MKYIFIVVIIFIISCSKEETKNEHIDFRFSKLSKESLSNSVKSYTIIPLETRTDVLLTDARNILIKDEKIFILENIMGRRHQIYIFNKEGRFVSKINSQGRGDKEYQSISDFDIHPNKDMVSILDPGLRKLMNFNFDSEYQNELKLDFWAKDIKYLNLGKHIYTIFSTRSSRSDTGKGDHIYAYNENNQLIYSALAFDKAISIAMGNGIHLTGNNGGVNYFKPNTNLIYSCSSDSVTLKYSIEYSFKVLPGEEIENVFMRGKNILHKYIYNIKYFEAKNIIQSHFSHNKEIYFGLYDKQSKKSLVFNDQIDPSCGCGINLNVKGTFDNSFILETDVLKINSLLKMLDPEKARCSNPKVLEMIKSLDMTSNPILILVEFKI